MISYFCKKNKNTMLSKEKSSTYDYMKFLSSTEYYNFVVW